MSIAAHVPLFPLPRLSYKLDMRTVRVGVLLAAVCILNGIDLAYTLFAQRAGMLNELNEQNPLAEVFLRMGLIPSLICFKVLMVMCGTGILWRLRQNRLVIPACWILLASYIALSLTWYVWISNVNTDLEIRITNALPLTP